MNTQITSTLQLYYFKTTQNQVGALIKLFLEDEMTTMLCLNTGMYRAYSSQYKVCYSTTDFNPLLQNRTEPTAMQ